MSLASRDNASVWHPFTSQGNLQPPVALVRGEGALLFDEKGKAYIDAIASWWVNLHGHAHPYIAKKISEQLGKLEHAIFSGFTHEPAIGLSERLLKLLPQMHRVFFSDDGSTAVEVGIKMALQYWSNKEKPRTKIIAFENAYHGDTFGSMSVGARNVFSQAFEKLLFEVVHIPVPVKGNETASVNALKNAIDENTAAFIFEPLVQGAGGMIMYEAKALDELLKICREKNVLTIADEVMTGFGRTGKMFATNHCGEKPDIVCLSKGLTGGFLPLGATLCTEKIYTAYLTSDKTKTFFHGHSYTGNPTACAAANASLDVFENEKTQEKIDWLSEYFLRRCEKFRTSEKIKAVRSTGAIFAIEIKTPGQTEYLNPLAERVHGFFLERGIILRPLGNILYVIPPYCITGKQLDEVMDAIAGFLDTL